MTRDHHPSLSDVTADTENTAFSIAVLGRAYTAVAWHRFEQIH
jgi:hypothetical protein